MAYNVLWRGMSTAIATAQEYADIFPDRFYLELQASHSMMQTLLNELLLKVAKRCNLPVVATNDCHYLCNEDSNAHDILLRIKTGRSALASFPAQDFYYKTPQEMAQTFAHIPEAIPNTVRIAASCVVDLAPADLLMPVYSSVQSPAQGSDSVCLLSGMTIFENWTGCLDQLERELDVIEGAGFSGFYLSAERLALCGSGASRSVFPDSSDSRSSLTTWRLQMESPHAISLRLRFDNRKFTHPERRKFPHLVNGSRLAANKRGSASLDQTTRSAVEILARLNGSGLCSRCPYGSKTRLRSVGLCWRATCQG